MPSVDAAFPTLLTERLVLRAIRPDDQAAIFAIFSNADVMRGYDREPMTAPHQAGELIAEFRRAREPGAQESVACRWGIALRKTDQLIGTCGLFARNQAFRSASLGYELAPPYWGHGYMQEALSALLDYAFGPLAINRLQATTDLDNVKSMRSLTRLGFQEEGILRQWGYWKDQFHDVRCYALLQSDARLHTAR